MQLDPIVGIVVGALVTVVGIFYRDLLRQRTRCETEVGYWRNRYFGALGRTELAADEAARTHIDD
jgi:hypothetical protein